MNSALVLSLLSLSTSPVAPVPKERPQNPFSWAYMGVRLQTAGNTESLQINPPEPGTPSYKAGHEGGDVLLKLGTITPKTFEDLQRYIINLRPGTVIAVELRRGQEIITLKLRLEERPNTEEYQILPSFMRRAQPQNGNDE